jgi:hypothetical protein
MRIAFPEKVYFDPYGRTFAKRNFVTLQPIWQGSHLVISSFHVPQPGTGLLDQLISAG